MWPVFLKSFKLLKVKEVIKSSKQGLEEKIIVCFRLLLEPFSLIENYVSMTLHFSTPHLQIRPTDLHK